MPEYLTPVVQIFDADISKYITKMEELKAAQETLGRQAGKTSDEFVKSQRDSEKAVTDFDRLMKGKIGEQETAWQALQRQIDQTKTKITGLKQELSKTGDVGAFQDLKKAQSDLKELENLAKDMVPTFKKSGTDSGNGFSSGFLGKVKGLFSGWAKTASTDIGKAGSDLASELAQGFSVLPTAIMPYLIGAAVGAAPVLISLIGGAVTTAVGAVGVVGGIVGAAHDPRVKAAFMGLGQEAMSIFQNVTQVFVGPVMAGIHDIEGMFARVSPGLEDAFRVLAEAARPLIDGFGGFITQMLPGLEAAFKQSLPVLQEFAKLLPFLGAAVGKMFAEITQNGPAGKLAIEGLVGVVGGLLIAIGKVINWSEDLFMLFIQGAEKGVEVAMSLSDALLDVAKFAHIGVGPAQQLSDSLHHADDKFKAMIADAKNGADTGSLLNVVLSNQVEAVNSLGDAYHLTNADLAALVQTSNDLLNLELKVSDAQVSMYQSLSNFTSTLKHTSHDWRITTQSGQTLRQSFNRAASEIISYYDKLATLHPLNRQQVLDALAQEDALYKQAKAAGASKDALQPLSDAIAILHQRLNELNNTTATFSVRGIIVGNVPLPSHAGHSVLAQGGVVHANQGLVSGILPPRDPGTWVLAGEPGTHGEIFMPLAGISQRRALDLAQIAGNAHGFDVVPRHQYAPALLGAQPGAGRMVIENRVYMDGKQVHYSLIQPTQRYKARTGTTGLT